MIPSSHPSQKSRSCLRCLFLTSPQVQAVTKTRDSASERRSYAAHPGNAGHSPFSIWFTAVLQVPHLLSNRQPTSYSRLLKILYLLPPRVSAPRPMFLTSQPRPIRIQPSHSLHHILPPKLATCGFLLVSRRGSAVYMPMLCTFVPV